MCGICGALAFSDSFAADDATVARMCETLAHRGPDDSGTHLAGPAALGHRRLSIIDLSPAGHQPMPNEDGTVWITYNGEVYNHEALRKELERDGHVFRSHTDTEAVVHLYERDGPRCVERLDGMFAFAIWDARRGELFLARDRVGVKPLYYAHSAGGFAFASEAKALLEHPAITPELDERAFFDYLTFAFTPPPRSMYAGISKLAAAERMTVRRDGSVHTERYWSPFSTAVRGEVARMSDEERRERLLELLRGSIRKRMMSDVPFGVFLSGGLDSSTNVALMSELTGSRVTTFSTAPRHYSHHDELHWARIVADRFDTDHHEVVIDTDDMRAFLPTLLYHQDEPLADWTAVPQHFISKHARDSGTIVIQAGEGSDELFHGYRGYTTHRRYVLPFQRYLPSSVQRAIAGGAVELTRRLGRGIRHGDALYDAAHSPLPYWGGSICFRAHLKQELLNDRHLYPDSYATVERLWAEADEELPGADIFQKMTYVELKQRLSELLLARFDRITMASSVEGREPFLDHNLVEFALALPPRSKYRRGETKFILKQAVDGILPHEIVYRKKQGFGTPMREWLRGDFGKEAERTVVGSSLGERGLLDMNRVRQLFEDHRAGRGDWSYHLWNLYSVSTWHDYWVAGRREEPALAGF
jgi:asparagine synthase (glutamine-hydrolysing)